MTTPNERTTTTAEQTLSPGWRETSIVANGMTFHAIEAGDPAAPAVLLLHGFPEFWFAWKRQIDPLANAGFRVIALDQRGYNLTDKPNAVDAYGIEHLRADVIAILDTLGLREVFLVAHDWGGHVAWSVAEHHPDRIRKLVILNVGHPVVMIRNFLFNPRQFFKSWYGVALQLPSIPEWLLSHKRCALLLHAMKWHGDEGPMTATEREIYRRAWSVPSALTSMINWYRALGRTWPVLAPPVIRVPTLLLWGQRDQFLEIDVGRQSIALCQSGRMVEIDATHWVHHERPELVRDHILEFFGGAA